MQKLRERRQEQLERYDLQAMLSDIIDRLDQVDRDGAPGHCATPGRRRQTRHNSTIRGWTTLGSK